MTLFCTETSLQSLAKSWELFRCWSVA